MKRFVLLDRDGTIIREANYLSSARQIELNAGVIEGLRLIQQMGLGLAVVTNQSGLARGYFSMDDLEKVHARLSDLLAAEGVKLDGIFFCPHKPADACNCRKPRPGLVEQAVSRLRFDPRGAFVIGDKPCDMELGQAIGATTILVRTGFGEATTGSAELSTDYVVDGLVEAAEVIRTILSIPSEDLP